MVKKRSIKSQTKLNERQKRQVKRLIGSRTEVKYANTLSQGGITSTGYIADLTPISQGDRAFERTGTEIYLKGLNINYQLRCGDETNEVRVLLVQWMEDTKNGILPTFPSILNVNAPSYITSLHQWDGDKNYKILYDRVHSLAGDGAVGGGTYVISPYGPASVTNQRVKIFGKKLTKKVHFQEGVAPESDGLNKIYMMVISDSSAISLVHPSIQYDALVSYTDS